MVFPSRLWLPLSVACITWVGCSSGPERVAPERRLPFAVRVLPVKIFTQEPPFENATWPAQLDLELLREDLAQILAETDVFSVTFTHGDLQDADLDLEVTLRDLDFGASVPTLVGSLVSTITWIAAGHFSWLIDNRTYSDSRVKMDIRIVDARGKEGEAPLFYDPLPLKGMSLNFLERAGPANWFLNILVPPWWGEGDPKEAGESLMAKSPQFFADQEIDRILASLPARYFERHGCFFGYEPERDRLVIVSQKDLERLHALGGVLKEETLENKRVRDKRDKADLRGWFLSRVSGLEIEKSDYRYYDIRLEGHKGLIHVKAYLEGDKIPACGTIRR